MASFVCSPPPRSSISLCCVLLLVSLGPSRIPGGNCGSNGAGSGEHQEALPRGVVDIPSWASACDTPSGRILLTAISPNLPPRLYLAVCPKQLPPPPIPFPILDAAHDLHAMPPRGRSRDVSPLTLTATTPRGHHLHAQLEFGYASPPSLTKSAYTPPHRSAYPVQAQPIASSSRLDPSPPFG